MCQLIHCNLNNSLLNGIFLSNLLQIDAGAGNKDGTGIFTTTKDETSIWKTSDSADNIPDLGKILKENIKSRFPVLAHVRSASKGIVVNIDNAHPFQGKRFTLAHNGRLYGKDEKVTYSSSNDNSGISSDSLQFLMSMEEKAKKKPDIQIVELLQSCMNERKGKFALLIYDKLTDKHYAVRGSSADLHISYILEIVEEVSYTIGYIINTKKDSLAEALCIGIPIAQFLTGRDIGSTKIEELEKNSIYILNKTSVEKIGELIESAVTYYSESSVQTRTWKASDSPVIDFNIDEWRYCERIRDFLAQHFLNLADFDAICKIFLDTPMATLTIDELQIFVEKVIPKISAPKKIRAKLSAIVGKGGRIYPSSYDKIKGLEYPWMLSHADQAKMDALRKHLISISKASKA